MARDVGLAAALTLMPLALGTSLLAYGLAVEVDLGPIWALMFMQAGLAGPALVAAFLAGAPAAALGLVRPSGRAMVGAVLIGLSYWYLSAAVVAPSAVTKRILPSCAARPFR